MEILRWIFGTICCSAFLWLTALNWQIFWKRHICKATDTPSWIPFLAGILGAIGLLVIPLGFTAFWWIPFFLDWGSLPGIGYSIWWHLARR